MFVPRESNQAAQGLSKLASCDVGEFQWLFEPPDCIVEIISLRA
jgi:hypothetical protein